jgi:hypothetical protein
VNWQNPARSSPGRDQIICAWNLVAGVRPRYVAGNTTNVTPTTPTNRRSRAGSQPPQESVRAELDSLAFNDEQLAGRVRTLEKLIDTRATPTWKRLWFRLDGWPPWYVLGVEPAWRPWRRWVRS